MPRFSSVMQKILERGRSFRGFRELLLVYHRYGKYAHVAEFEFSEKMLYWHNPCLDATRYGIDVLATLGGRTEYSNKYKRKIIEFLLSNYDTSMGAFRQCREARPTVYATYCAIAILRSLLEMESARILGKARIEEVLGKGKSKRIIGFMEQSQSPETGGFFEGYGLGYRPTMSNTYLAFYVLREMGEERRFETQIRDFVDLCLRSTPKGEKGFVESPMEKEPLLCSTYSALRILTRLNKDWVTANSEEIAGFVGSCIVENKNTLGFGFRPGGPATLLHTNLALLCLEMVGLNLEAVGANERKVGTYIRACWTGCDDFRFRPVSKRFLFRPYAPHLNLIRNTIRNVSRFKAEYTSLESLFSEVTKNETIEFIHRFKQENGTFVGTLSKHSGIPERLYSFFLSPRENPRPTPLIWTPTYDYRASLVRLPIAISGLGLSAWGWSKNFPFVLNMLTFWLGLNALAFGTFAVCEIFFKWFKKR